MMYTHYGLFFLTYYIVTGLSLPATYDQRQTGDLNVQVHLKDIQVLALLDSEVLDDYTEYDYFYDYADFTLKPTVKPTTSTTESASPSSGTTDASETPDSSSQNSTVLSSTDSLTNLTNDATNLTSTDAEKTNATTATLSTENTEDLISINDTSKATVKNNARNISDEDDEDLAKRIEGGSTRNPLTRLSRKRCRTGYSKDGKGRCRRQSQRRLSLIPLAIKLAPKLLDDLARTTKNLAQEEVDRMHYSLDLYTSRDPKLPRKRTNLSHSRGSDFVQLGRFERTLPEGFGKMLLHAACLLFLPDILLRSFVSHVSAAPATYDQRQSGDFNVDAKFENFLIIVATSGTSSLFNNLATQALELNDLISRSKQSQEKSSETMIYETEDANSGKEPYHVEIVHIDKGDDKSEKDVPKEKIKTENSERTDLVADDEKGAKRARSLFKSEKYEHTDRSMKENKKPIERRNSHVKNLEQSDDLPVKEETLKAARPGISLKKQLSKSEEESAPLVSEERNELGHNYQELILLGDGIENCGPGRYRDKLGICQKDKSFQEN
nr:PREDICTED: uncharacterized protein LOC100881220 [Megachile rotundata]